MTLNEFLKVISPQETVTVEDTRRKVLRGTAETFLGSLMFTNGNLCNITKIVIHSDKFYIAVDI